MTNTSTWHTSISDAIKVPIEKGRQSVFIFEDKDMQVRFYSPKQKDNQTPHHQDEVYVIAKGSGKFVRGNDEISFKIGDIIFVPKKNIITLKILLMTSQHGLSFMVKS